MTIKDYIGFAVLIIFIAAGIYIGGFIGGCITGTCTGILIFVTLGKRLARKTAKNIDEQITAMHRRNDEVIHDSKL